VGNMALELILILPIGLLAISMHEYSHGLASHTMGDPTPEMNGRLTINPIAHLDPVGLIVLLLTRRIGWAKPVPINPRYYSNPRRDIRIVSFAGPASNLIMAIFFALLLNILPVITGQPLQYLMYGFGGNTITLIFQLLFIAVQINIVLAVFNLLPVPPLDGSKILQSFLPSSFDKYFYQLEGPIGMIIIIALIYTGILWAIIGPVIDFVMNLLLFF